MIMVNLEPIADGLWAQATFEALCLKHLLDVSRPKPVVGPERISLYLRSVGAEPFTLVETTAHLAIRVVFPLTRALSFGKIIRVFQ